MDAETTVRSFIEAINAHDVDRIRALCAADHRFVDTHGGVVQADGIAKAWTGYFRFMPGYGIEIEEIVSAGGSVAVFGAAWGTLSAPGEGDRSWRCPAAWRAKVSDGRIALWQVYVDTKPVFDLLAPGAGG